MSPLPRFLSLLALAIALIASAPATSDAGRGGKAKKTTTSASTSKKSLQATPDVQRASRDFRVRNPKLGKKIDLWKKRYVEKAKKRGVDNEGNALKGKSRLKADAKLQKRVTKLQKKIARTQARDAKKVLIVLDGADGAGKSSTMEWITPVFSGAREVREARIGASPDGRSAIERVDALLADLPPGGVLLLDRYAGDAVFDDTGAVQADDAKADIAIQAYDAFERRIAPDVDVIKFQLDITVDRQAKTFGKREALRPDKLSVGDYRAFENRDAIGERFRYVAQKSSVGWNRIEMNDRVEGRNQMFDVIEGRFE